MNGRWIFPSADAAMEWLSIENDDARRQISSELSFGGKKKAKSRVIERATSTAKKVGGQRSYTYESALEKESFVYGYQSTVIDQDLEYLYNKDGTIRTICRKPARDTWFKMPETDVEPIDEFLQKMTRLGFNQKAKEADALARAYGGSFLYINASGDIEEPLPRDTGKVHGFTVIHPFVVDDVVWDDTGRDIYQQHGISKLKIKGRIETGERDDDGRMMTRDEAIIDGSRLIRFRHDNSTDRWRGQPQVLPVFDDIWNLRDVVYAQTNAQFEGDPIAMTVTDPDVFSLKQETIDNLEDDVEEFITSGRQVWNPVQGLTIERIGGPELQEPEDIIWTLTSRIAQVSELPVKMLMASPAASDQVEDSDILSYGTDIEIQREDFAIPILQHLTLLGKWIRDIPSTATFPNFVDWPELRLLSPRERGYLWGQAARVLPAARDNGRRPPREVDQMMPEDPDIEPVEDDGGGPNSMREMKRMLDEILHKLDEG